jgi:hypothetical protein
MSTKQNIIKIIVLLPLLLLLSLSFVFAQGQGGNTSNSNSSGQGAQTQGDGEPIQDRDRDQLQDGSGGNCINIGDCDGVPDQDRLQTQDRDRLQDSSLHIGDQPIQDQAQLRDRLRDQLENPDQNQDRDRIRANDSAGLQEVISTSQIISEDVTNGLRADIRELARNRNRVEVGVVALIASQNMVGKEGGAIANLAQEIQSMHRTMIQEEEQIQSRGILTRFFFGGDSENATAIHNQLQQNQERMQQIRQYLNDCDCEEQVRTILQEQLQAMEEEHERLRKISENEVSTWGLFSWRF